MNGQCFSLRPFPGDAIHAPDIQVTGRLQRKARSLSIAYELAGALVDIDLPGLAPLPLRKNHLWEATCLEVFFKMPGAKAYWEVNLSPSGHWNVFRFDGYREGMREEMKTGAPAVYLETGTAGVFKLSADISLEGISSIDQSIRVAVSAVIKTLPGRVSFWALAHPALKPDFHHTEGFLLTL